MKISHNILMRSKVKSSSSYHLNSFWARDLKFHTEDINMIRKLFNMPVLDNLIFFESLPVHAHASFQYSTLILYKIHIYKHRYFFISFCTFLSSKLQLLNTKVLPEPFIEKLQCSKMKAGFSSVTPWWCKPMSGS